MNQSGSIIVTLVTNLNPPSIIEDTSWVKPGRASWSWLFDHDSPPDHDKLGRWIDLATDKLKITL